MPPAPSPAAVLFDLDGTLIATRRLYLESFADAMEPILGRRPPHEWFMERRPRAEVRFLLELAGEVAHAEVMERFYRSYEARHDRDFEGIYEGVKEMLETLRGAGLPLGIVTGKSRRSWEITSRRVRLGEFGVTVFDDDVPAPKPDPTGLFRAAEALDVPPDRVLYVGDSGSDLEAARRAGARGLAVLWAKRSHEVDGFRERARTLGAGAVALPGEVTRLVLSV
jgi:HAD superfamily hydrolase (TIGR01549 family)